LEPTPTRSSTFSAAASPHRGLEFLVGSWTTSDTIINPDGSILGTSIGEISYRSGVADAWPLFDFATTLPGIGPYRVHGASRWDAAGSVYRAVVLNNLGDALT
jgi:hypothetical protein